MIKVIKFGATWCQPCKVIAPVLDEIQQHFAGQINYQNIDVDHNKTLPSAYNITSVPTVVIEKNGKEIQRIIGAKPKSVYIQAIQSQL